MIVLSDEQALQLADIVRYHHSLNNPEEWPDKEMEDDVESLAIGLQMVLSNSDSVRNLTLTGSMMSEGMVELISSA